jgi:uncharacterized membrane protein YhhN
VALAVAVVDWVAILADRTVLQDIAKPLTTIVLIAWFRWATGQEPDGWRTPRTLFTVGLCFSLSGDIFLIGSGSTFFTLGLAGFLLAHLSYIGGFNSPWVRPGRLTLVAGLALLVYAIVLCARIEPHTSGFLTVAVPIYALALGTMVLSAIDTWRRPDWRRAAAGLATAGGLAFLASDSTLAYGQFITHHINELAVMTTYFLGQFGIIAGVVNRTALQDPREQ